MGLIAASGSCHRVVTKDASRQGALYRCDYGGRAVSMHAMRPRGWLCYKDGAW